MVLAVTVLYRGCAIPVAWKIVRSNAPGSWEQYWTELLSQLAQAVPPDWLVLVLADRGLYAKWLYEHIVGLKWHPFLRINRTGKVRPVGESHFRWLSSLVPEVGTSWSGVVDCFAEATCRVQCTLLARWDEPYAEAWLVVTDLAPEAANIVWYSMRTWIEAGVKVWSTSQGGFKKTLPVKAPPPPLRACPMRSGSSSGLSRNLPLRAGGRLRRPRPPCSSITAFDCQNSSSALRA